MKRRIYLPHGWTVDENNPPGPILLKRCADALSELRRLSESVREGEFIVWHASLGLSAGRLVGEAKYPAAAQSCKALGDAHAWTIHEGNVRRLTSAALAEHERLRPGIPEAA